MNLRDKLAGESDDPVVAQALEHFKASVDASSRAAYSRLDAAHSRPRTTVARPTGFAAANWRWVAGWALGCVLAAGSLAGAVYEHYHRQELARIAAMQAAQKARQARLEAEKSAAA